MSRAGQLLANLTLVGILVPTLAPLFDHHFAERLPNHGHVHVHTPPAPHDHLSSEPHPHGTANQVPSTQPGEPNAIAVVSKELSGGHGLFASPMLTASSLGLPAPGPGNLAAWPEDETPPIQVFRSPPPPPPRL